MMVYFDTEFTGLHKETTLISLGMIDDFGHKFYAIFTDYDKSQCDSWIEENVINNLYEGKDSFGRIDFVEGDKDTIKKAILKWFHKILIKSGDDRIELVSDVAHYDMVLFIDIFGTAFDLPKYIAPACIDINQLIAEAAGISLQEAFDTNREDFLEAGYPDHYVLKLKNKHNSLYDAIVIKGLFDVLMHI